MSEANTEILRRLADCETDLAAHRGYLKALEYGLRAAVITHSRPDVLHRAWMQLLPGIAEKHASEEGVMFTSALQQTLALLTDQIADSCREQHDGWTGQERPGL